jgi:hypothetical protein
MKKRDPELHPVRFIAGLWEQRTGSHLTSKELGQLRDPRKALGDVTLPVLEWMADSTNWWYSCQHVRAAARLHSTPPFPHVGFLLSQRQRALTFVRARVAESTIPMHVEFCRTLDRVRFDNWKTLLIVFSAGRPAWLPDIEAADSIPAPQRIFIGIADADAGRSPQDDEVGSENVSAAIRVSVDMQLNRITPSADRKVALKSCSDVVES